MVILGAYLPGRNGGVPYDSAQRMPMWSYIVALCIILYIVIRVWEALKKDKKGQKSEIKRRNPDI